jgi:ABC-2 type transport system permease protein
VSGLRDLLDVYRAQFRTTFGIQLQYRVVLVIWLIGLILEPLMYLVVWETVARSRGEDVGGYGPGDFAAYFLVLMVVNQMTFTWVIGEAEYRIREGVFSPLLLRPVHPIHNDVAFNLTYKLLTLTIVLPAAVGLGWLFDARFAPPGWAVAAFVPALLLAYAVHFLVDWTVSLAAFWVTRMGAINQSYAVLTIFLTGQVAPLSLFPEPVRVLATVLPFRWMVAFPVELLLGRLSGREALVGLGVQAGWLVAALVGLRLLWGRATRRYAAVGA